MPTCNICGGQEFVRGPNERLSASGMPPQCVGCRSLERQRSLRDCLLRVPREMLSWRRALQFAPDASLDPTWFKTFERSVYEGENSIDLQQINRPDDAYDFISLSSVLEFVPDDRNAFAELARIGSNRCVLHCTFLSSLHAPTSSHFEEPHGTFGRYHDYGADLEEWFETDRHQMSTLVVRTIDPVTNDMTSMHFFCSDRDDAKILQESFANGMPELETTIMGQLDR